MTTAWPSAGHKASTHAATASHSRVEVEARRGLDVMSQCTQILQQRGNGRTTFNLGSAVLCADPRQRDGAGGIDSMRQHLGKADGQGIDDPSAAPGTGESAPAKPA